MKPRRRPSKIITRVIVFLLLGAIVNVAVAWGCAYWIVDEGYDGYELDVITTLGLKKEMFPELVDEKCLLIDGYESRTLGRRTTSVSVSYASAAYEHFINNPKPGGYSGPGGEEMHLGRIECAGYPLLSVQGIARSKSTGPTRDSHWAILLPLKSKDFVEAGLYAFSLPYAIMLPGFAINTIFYAAIFWLLFFAPGSVRRTLRRRRGLCPACAYPVGTSPVCTECGSPLPLKGEGRVRVDAT